LEKISDWLLHENLKRKRFQISGEVTKQANSSWVRRVPPTHST